MEAANAAQKKLMAAFQQADADIKMKKMRPIQRKSYECSAKCCSPTTSPNEETLLRCLEQCGAPLQQAAQVFQTEAQRFQQRLQRCSANCQDKAQDVIGGDPSKADPKTVARAEKAFGDCTASCMQEHIGMIPGLRKSIEGRLSQL